MVISDYRSNGGSPQIAPDFPALKIQSVLFLVLSISFSKGKIFAFIPE